MSVIVDTSVWSLALRRKSPVDSSHTQELARLIVGGAVTMIGPIRQELLSGVPTGAQFERLQQRLAAFPDAGLQTADYELAGAFHSRCRAKGVQGSNTDFLICSFAVRREMSILTVDRDFERFARILKVQLHQVEAS